MSSSEEKIQLLIQNGVSREEAYKIISELVDGEFWLGPDSDKITDRTHIPIFQTKNDLKNRAYRDSINKILESANQPKNITENDNFVIDSKIGSNSKTDLQSRFKLSNEFDSVNCGGKHYVFKTPSQIAIIRVLWNHTLDNLPYNPKKPPALHTDKILNKAKDNFSVGFQAKTIPEIFRNNDFYDPDQMLFSPDGKRGYYALKIP